jgi:hypothetical protein
VTLTLELIPILPQFAARQSTFLPPSKNSTGKGTTQHSVCVDPKHWPVNHSKPLNEHNQDISPIENGVVFNLDGGTVLGFSWLV